MRRRYSRIPVVPIVGALLHTAAGSLARAEVASLSDPFAYCAAVGTADTPGPRYTGPAMPEAVARGLGAALGAPAHAPLDPFLEQSVWRCMGGEVYACTFGANRRARKRPMSAGGRVPAWPRSAARTPVRRPSPLS